MVARGDPPIVSTEWDGGLLGMSISRPGAMPWSLRGPHSTFDRPLDLVSMAPSRPASMYSRRTLPSNAVPRFPRPLAFRREESETRSAVRKAPAFQTMAMLCQLAAEARINGQASSVEVLGTATLAPLQSLQAQEKPEKGGRGRAQRQVRERCRPARRWAHGVERRRSRRRGRRSRGGEGVMGHISKIATVALCLNSLQREEWWIRAILKCPGEQRRGACGPGLSGMTRRPWTICPPG